MLDFQLSTIVWTVVNLLVLYLFLKKFLFGRINAMLDKRSQMVEETIADAERKRTEAEKLRADYESHVAAAHEEAEIIVTNAKKRADAERERLLSEAQENAHAILTAAQLRGERDRENMLRSARAQVVSLSLLAASKLAGKKLDSDTDREIIDEFLNEAGERR
ncbi:MAG: F0F1 ATP synthase subunit B [Oscillospiraceae bacterium]